MDNLNREIKKQVEYCLNFNRYKARFFVSDVSKINKIKEILDGVNKIVGQMMHVVKLKENELYVEFWNGSSMKVFVPFDNCRGYKINGCLIDEDIAQDIKNCILRQRSYQDLLRLMIVFLSLKIDLKQINVSWK